jgi:hypothetical protein
MKLIKAKKTAETYEPEIAPIPETKFCPVCKEHKATSEFHRNSTKVDGLSWDCKACNGAFVLRSRRLNQRIRKTALEDLIREYDEVLLDELKMLAVEDVRSLTEEVLWIVKDHVRFIRSASAQRLEAAKRRRDEETNC